MRPAQPCCGACWKDTPRDRGAALRVPAVGIEPLPLQNPASMMWLAAISDPSCALAGEMGHHLLLARGVPEDRLRHQIEVYREARAAFGHDVKTGYCQVTRGIYVAENEEQAWAEAAPGIERYFRQSQKVPPDAAVPSLSEMAQRGYFIVGDPRSCAEQVSALARAVPITHLACDVYLPRVASANLLRSIRLFGERVIPLCEEALTPA